MFLFSCNRQLLMNEKIEIEDLLNKCKDDLDLKQRQIDEMMNQKLELEKEIKQLKVQLNKLKFNEIEMDKLKKEFDSLYEDLNKLRNENSDLLTLTKQLDRDNVNLKDQFTVFRNDMEDEKKQFYEFKQNSERNLNRIKNSFDLERDAFKEEISELKDALQTEKQKRKDIKIKCVQYCDVAKKLHKQLKQLESEKNGGNKIFRSSNRSPIRNAIKSSRSQIEQSNQQQFDLRKQYKEMKKMLNEIQNSDYCKIHQPIKS